MSWLSFNESLNSIKGQLSSFASGVLADGIVGETENGDVSPTNNKIDLEEQRKALSAELHTTVSPSRNIENANNTWSWESPGEPPIPNAQVVALQKQVEILENEKKDLIVSLEQLDLDCQQTTDKLVTLKDNLQASYNDLKANFEKLQKEYGEVLTENMDKSKEIEILKVECSKNSAPNSSELIQKYEELKKNYENSKSLSEEEQNRNNELKKSYRALEEENATLRAKIEESEKIKENNADVEQETTKLQMDNGELCNELTNLKLENVDIKSAKDRIQQENETLRNEGEKLRGCIQKLEGELEKSNNDAQSSRIQCEKIQNDKDMENKNIEKLQQKLEQLESAHEKLKAELNRAENITSDELQLKNNLRELSSNNEKLSVDQENLTILVEQLKNDLQNLQHTNDELNEEMNNNSFSVNEKFAKEKEALHEKYLSIITENMRKYIDLSTNETSPISTFLPDEPQILEFAGKVETLLKLLLDFKCKTETLEKDLCEVTQEKNKAIAEKNFEIEKLLKNSEILSQEVITKTQAIKDYEDECGELMKNNDLLISELQNYKNSSGLQTISESNEDNLLLLETQLENANKKIQDMELIISDLENSKQEANLETQTELDYIKKQLNMTGQELSHSKAEYQELMVCYKNLEEEKQNLKSILDKIRLEYENTEYKYTEVNVGMETLKEENEEYKNKLVDYEKCKKKLEDLKFNLESKVELLQNVVDDVKQKLEVERENTSQKELQIRNLVERLQNSKMCETGLKLQVDTIYKELQTVAEGKQALEAKYVQVQNKLQELQEELVKSKEEFNRLHKEELKNGDIEEHQQSDNLQVQEIQKQLNTANHQNETESFKLKHDLSVISTQNRDLLQKLAFLETQLIEITTSRNELVGLITAKHQENIQYHGEIQRLNRILASETEKAHLLEIQLQNVKPDVPAEELLKKQEELTQKLEVIEKLTDQNNFLREKCEVLAQNLLQEQSNVQKVLGERISASEKEQSLAKELERLRAHLVEIEEMYTHELLQAEQKNKEMLVKVNEIEQREKDSSSIYTSVSIRANQQVETLQTQLQLVTNQRDELRVKVSDLEDDHNKQVAALTNLQLVLEQFQKERDKDVYQETERIRRQINVEKRIQEDLRGEIGNLRLQLDESKQGLQAASRLTDQLDKCKQQIVNYRDEVTKLQEELKSKEAKYKELTTQTDSKVDKTLIKNLIIGYITSHSSDQNQILKIVATVLDFNQTESDKVNLNKPQHGGWLGSILHPQNLNSSPDLTQQSLSEAFVRFLEKESKPKVLPNLLITSQAKTAEGSSSSTGTPRQSPSPMVLSEVLLPTFVDFGKSRNSSSILKDVLKDNS